MIARTPRSAIRLSFLRLIVMVDSIGTAFCRFLLCVVSLLIAISLSAITVTAKPKAQNGPPHLPPEDAALIAEAFHLRKTLGGKVWRGWDEATTPLLYVKDQYEFAIGFPSNTGGFKALAPLGYLQGLSLQARGRTFPHNIAAALDVEGVNAVVIGSPDRTGKQPNQWVITAVHEMFHVWQFANGSGSKIADLNLGSGEDASWQINFPFPYKDEEVMRLIHLQGYLVFLASSAKDLNDARYNGGTAIDALKVYKAYLRSLDASQKLYGYSQFQEWDEGVAFYTEYRMAELAAANYKPSASAREIRDFKSYRKVWDETYKNRIFLVKHAGRAARSRTAFYHLGLGKALLLDWLMPDWKSRYFTRQVWLDDLLVEALTKETEPK